MQVAPIKPVLKPPGSMLLKLRYDGPLSKNGLNFSLRRYNTAETTVAQLARTFQADGDTTPTCNCAHSCWGKPIKITKFDVTGRDATIPELAQATTLAGSSENDAHHVERGNLP